MPIVLNEYLSAFEPSSKTILFTFKLSHLKFAFDRKHIPRPPASYELYDQFFGVRA